MIRLKTSLFSADESNVVKQSVVIDRAYVEEENLHLVKVHLSDDSITALSGEYLTDAEAVERAENLAQYPQQGFLYRNFRVVSK